MNPGADGPTLACSRPAQQGVVIVTSIPIPRRLLKLP